MTDSIPRLAAATLEPQQVHAAIRDVGCVLLEGVFTTEEVQRPLDAWCEILRAWLHEHGHPAADSTDPEALHDAIRAVSPDAAQVALGLGRDLPDYIHLISHPKLRALVGAAMGSTNHQLAFDHCLMRVDRPLSDATNFTWHQDYTYNVLSEDAVTFWIPLVPITAEMGPLSVVPGSHGTIRPARMVSDAPRFDPNRLPLVVDAAQQADWEARRVEVYPVSPGSLLLFSCTLLHRSGPNRSNRTRFVANGRYGRFDDAALVRRNWYTARTKYPHFFAQAHPDLVHE